jgi:hypothetical protein
VTPVRIRCEPLTLGKGEKWWRVPPRRVRFRLEVAMTSRLMVLSATASSEVMAARRLTDYLQNYFTEEVQRHA